MNTVIFILRGTATHIVFMGISKINMKLEKGTFCIFHKRLLKGQSCYVQILYTYLYDHANKKTGECFPSVRLLSEECGMSFQTVLKATKKLEQLGFISSIHCKTKKNNYLINDLKSVVNMEQINKSTVVNMEQSTVVNMYTNYNNSFLTKSNNKNEEQKENDFNSIVDQDYLNSEEDVTYGNDCNFNKGYNQASRLLCIVIFEHWKNNFGDKDSIFYLVIL